MLQMFDTRRKAPLKLFHHEQHHEAMREDIQIFMRNQQRRMSQQCSKSQVNRALHESEKLKDVSGRTSFEQSVNSDSKSYNKCSQHSPHFSPAALLPRRSQRTSDLHENGDKGDQIVRISDEERYSRNHSLGEKWEKPVSYPTVGKKKATVEWEDLERLDDGQFLNDNLIGFYLRVLEEELQQRAPTLAKRVYFFNTFFYERLTKPHKGPKGINYEGVQKWTRLVDLFTYDYVIVPINESVHWYVAVICNLTALDRSTSSSHTSDAPADAELSETPVGENPRAPFSEQRSEPNENETAQSFAGMSLGGREHKNRVNSDLESEVSSDQIARDEDTHMLDSSVEASFNQAISSTNPPQVMDGDVKGSVQACQDIESEAMAKASSTMKKAKQKSQPPVTKINPNKPVIITFDSLGASHAGTIKWLKIYLQEEAKAKRGNMRFDLGAIKGVTARSIPQQTNSTDCGLFMLGYISKLLANEPKEFITNIIRRQYDEQRDWPDLIPCEMRASIRERLQLLHEESLRGKSGTDRRIGVRRPTSELQIRPEACKLGMKQQSDIATSGQPIENLRHGHSTTGISTEYYFQIKEPPADKLTQSQSPKVVPDLPDNLTLGVDPPIKGVPLTRASLGTYREPAESNDDLHVGPRPKVHCEDPQNATADHGSRKSVSPKLLSEVPDSQPGADLPMLSTPQGLPPSQLTDRKRLEKEGITKVLLPSKASIRPPKTEDKTLQRSDNKGEGDDAYIQQMTAIEIDD